jgi:arylsulfatase A-like enzyme
MEADRPDLILFMTDGQRHDQVGYASGGHFETPTLDALAAEGVIFDSAYSASTTCVPSRVALLTGLQPHRLPVQENWSALREGFWTVAHELRAAGYETAIIGKAHFAPVHARHGFETMRLCEHLKWQGLGPLSKERGDEYDDYHDWLLEQGLDDWRLVGDRPMPADYPPEAHPTAWIEREVTEFLARRDRSRPLFLIVSFPHPHAPYDPPEPYASMFDPGQSLLPASDIRANELLPEPFREAVASSPDLEEAADARRLRPFLAIVRGLVRQIDDAIGRLVAQVDLGETIVFFTADHGDFAGNRGLMRKTPWIPFDDLVRVPFFVCGAGIAGGRRVSDLVQSFDFALTCLDYARVDAPGDLEFDSRSLRPHLDSGTHPVPDRAVFSGTGITGWPMIRSGRFKYIQHGWPGEAVLFDLEADPREQVNLADDPRYAGVCRDLAARLQLMIVQEAADLPAPEPEPEPELPHLVVN